MCSLRSPETTALHRVPLRPLLAKELREVLNGRALWTMLILLCPLVGYSFFQATSLYGEASAAARDSPAMASGLSPLDGVLVPTFGAFYLAVTLLFPFVAIRVLGREKETGALRLLLQLPYRMATLIAAKMTAIATAWVIALIPALSTLALWEILGGHLSPPETVNLLGGHLLYGLLIGAIALFSAAISESAATAAIITLSFTIGSWVLDFALAGQPGVLGLLSRLSLTQTLRTFEQGLLSAGLVVGIATAIVGFCVLAAIWLHPGVPVRAKLARSLACTGGMAALLVKYLVRDGTYTVVEPRLVQILQPQQSPSGEWRTDLAEAARVGRMLGVDAIVVGTIVQFGAPHKNMGGGGGTATSGGGGGGFAGKESHKAVVALNARVVDIESGEVVAVADGTGQSIRTSKSFTGFGMGSGGFGFGGMDFTTSGFLETIIGEATEASISQLSKDLIAANRALGVRRRAVDGLVAHVKGSVVVLNVGTKTGVYAGDVLAIERVTEVIRDPATGEVIRRMTSKVGEVRVTKTDEISSECEVMGEVEVRVGDIVRRDGG